MQQQEFNDNLKKISTWKRIFFMLIFSVIIGLVRVLLWAVIFFQVAFALLMGEPNKNILNFGQALATYLYHMVSFLTYNTDHLPFPFSDWGLTEEIKPENLKTKL